MSVSEQMMPLNNPSEIPAFQSEQEEAEFWTIHEITEEFIERGGPVPEGELPPPRLSNLCRGIPRGCLASSPPNSPFIWNVPRRLRRLPCATTRQTNCVFAPRAIESAWRPDERRATITN